MNLKRFTLQICLMLITSGVIFAQVTDVSSGKEYVAGMLPDGASITIDGMMDEDVWNHSSVVSAPMDTFLINPNNSALILPTTSFDLIASYKATWDMDNLYLFVEVEDDVFLGIPQRAIDEEKWWMADQTEIFFNVDTTKGYSDGTASQVRVNLFKDDPEKVELTGGGYALGNEADATGWDYAWTETDFGYNIEIQIPWSLIVPDPSSTPHPFEVAEGSYLGFDVQHADADDETRIVNNDTQIRFREHIASWNSRTHRSFNTAESFGVLTLGSAVPVSVDSEVFGTVSVYPNPAHKYLKVDLAAVKDVRSIEVISITGQVVAKMTDVSSSNTFNIENLSSGVYFVSVSGLSGKEIYKVLIN